MNLTAWWPWPRVAEPAPEPRPPRVIVEAGALVTCDNGHEIAVVKEPGLFAHTKVKRSQFDWLIPEPSNAKIEPCPHCGAPYILIGATMVNIGGKWRG